MLLDNFATSFGLYLFALNIVFLSFCFLIPACFKKYIQSAIRTDLYILSVQEVLTPLYNNLRHKLGQDFLNKQYKDQFKFSLNDY